MAEVPVSDVLCEATEYLCKLGFNLRSRSRNLKEKRINKDKLKNTHAVRKAATKLLLMCELSKKSLENVENGVRKVLGIIESSRRSPCVGAVNETSKTEGSKKEWFYIEYDSCKLRISKKILLEHYMSVKVHAKSMPVSMMENYPVYYKCALYKNRKKTLRESRFADSNNERSRINLKKSEFLKNVPNKEASGSDVQELAQGKENNMILDLCDTTPGKSDKKKNEKSSDNDSELPKPTEQSDADAEVDQNKATLHNKEIKKSPDNLEPKQTKRDTLESAESDCNSKNPEKVIEENNRDKNASQSSNVQETDVRKEDTDGSHSVISSKKTKKVEETQESAKIIKLFDKCSGSQSEGKETCVEPNSENGTKLDNDSTHEEMSRRRSCSVDKDKKLQDKFKDSRDQRTRDLKSEKHKFKSNSNNKKSSGSKSKDKEICVEPNSEICAKSDNDSTFTQNGMSSKKSHSVEKDNEVRQSKSENSRDHLQSDTKPDELESSSKSYNSKNNGSQCQSTKVSPGLNSENCTKSDNNGTKACDEVSQKKTHSVEKETEILQHKSENSRDHLQSDLKPEIKTGSKSSNNKKNSGSESEGKELCGELNSENNTKLDNDGMHDKLSRKKSHSVDKVNGVLQDKSEDSRENLQSDITPADLKTCSKSGYNKIAYKEETEGKVEDSNVNCRMSSKSPSVMLLDSDSDSSAQPIKNSEDHNSKKRKLIEKKQRKENRRNNSIEHEVVNLIDDDDSPRKQNQLPKDEDSHSKTGKKPMIKLVSLNKLLKPDIVKSNLHEINEKSKNKKAKLEIAYLQEKKREVLAFKPKKFNVVITRLPKFSDDYLRKYGLHKIIKQGVTIYQLTNESLKDTESNIDLTKSRHSSEKAKSSENIETIEIDLTDDDTSMDKTIQEMLVEKDDKPELDMSTVETDKDKKSECDENNKLSEDRPRTPESKNKNPDQTTPRSMRKAIMKSMEAKKLLLTKSSSSSSDSDDDLVKIAIKAKHSLLNGSSSDEDVIIKPKLAKRRQLVTPSDSDDSLKISKKLLKHKKYKGLDTEASSISQIDGTNDELSSTGSSKMGRSKTKVSSSSKQTSESVDSNDEINRLTDLNSLTRSRRRHPRSSRDAHARSTRRMPKAPPIQIEGDVLPLESSDSVSGNDSTAGDVEDLPPITMQELNGDGINDLAKQDLLAQSDSSSSQNEKANGSEEEKIKGSEDDDVEDNVKSRRRKTHTISSDSEAGSSRRKANKLSDFDDSEEESQPRKKTKRKKKESDSDASLSSQDGSKKKRRRIKQVKDSDGSGSDTENEGKNKHGRKNIRKVMSKDQLEEATKKAARQEKERVARIAERQKTYNNVEFDESGKPDEVVLEKVVLDFDPETKEPLIQVDRGLVRKLKPHQANGIKFMWNACFESVKRIKKDRGSGCILAHCMGLGKTLQVVSLTHTLLVHSDLTKVKRVLVVCPLSTVLNWVNEFNMWLKHSESDFEVNVFELSKNKQNSERAFQLQQWMECGGVCVLGYEMFRNLSADNNKKFKKKMLATFQQALVEPGPDLVVCDEGHLLKNEKTSLSQSMNRVRTLRRIVLTGTPLQNNLKEYYCMVTFVKPNLLGKYNEYLNRFVNPITNGQYTDSTERDISIMKRRSHVLHTMLDGAVQRRDYGVLAPFLPPKHEYVLFITLTEIQTKLYQHYLDNYSRRPLPGKSSGFLFPDFQSLQRIWTHPLVLKYNSERYEIMQQKKRDKEEEDSEGSLADFIDDDSTPDESSTEESSDDLSDASDDSRKKSKKKKAAKKGKGRDKPRRGTRANPVEQLEEDKGLSDVEEVKYENPTEWWMKLVTDEELEDMRHSHKLLLLFDILRQCDAIGDKLLVFSQSLYSLDLIEHFLGKVDEATQDARIDEKLAGHVGSWSPGVDYFRLDGSTSCENRSIWCRNFNREDNPRARLFLISTRAGGLGINLVAANRVVIFDVSWNPSHDVQSIFRVYRFGQKKPCYIYRFLAMGTMEEKIYERQVTKQAISKRVIDEQQIDRHYAANDLAELYRFEPVPAEPRPTPPLPKDRLFAEMLKDREAAIFRFHEHDSLLENKEEETLSEEERKRAWEEFENEKRAPPPQAFQPPWAMTNGMAASLLQQQQQQLAYAALAAMIRKDMPTINDAQIRDMLPIICNANPGLMQKMSDIYKYAQPGLMNPSMMNPAINPASGMSTSSSLQYEPPWQRQQQQQQQMRLQQLMQQQSMGAKYYAGGLGSRDPVAMALQQQRAREFLLGGGVPATGAGGAGSAGRPRGRPPLQPRAPPSQDVVNLADSD